MLFFFVLHLYVIQVGTRRHFWRFIYRRADLQNALLGFIKIALSPFAPFTL